jgi:DMSO/TMAO reductase YedYZ molybdopterin-dependent catalytic subunit
VAALAGCGGGTQDGSPIVGGGADAGAGPPDADPPDATAPETCPDDPLAGGELLAVVPLLDSGSPDLGRLYGEGLDARLMTDLGLLGPDEMVTPLELYYLRTSTPDALPAARGWKVRLGGLVEADVELTIDELLAASRDQGTFVMECAGNSTGAAFGLMSAGRWRGVPIGEVLDRARPLPAGARLQISGYDRHDGPSETSFAGASWIFTRRQLEDAGAFLATHLDGEPLGQPHGAPVRLYVPGWYGCVCVKWLETIDFVDDEVAPTFHMLEFARRTLQDGEPKKARDWAPAVIDQAAMPVRVERWRVGDRERYKVTGILWGGGEPTDALEVRFGADDAWRRAEVCPSMRTNETWTLWTAIWDPPGPGTYEITCRVDDPSIRQRRLDSGYYLRRVKI